MEILGMKEAVPLKHGQHEASSVDLEPSCTRQLSQSAKQEESSIGAECGYPRSPQVPQEG
jgi:hypothetical protein